MTACTLTHGFDGLVLPSYSRQRNLFPVPNNKPVVLVSDTLTPPAQIRVSQRAYRLSLNEHELLRDALVQSVEIRAVLKRS